MRYARGRQSTAGAMLWCVFASAATGSGGAAVAPTEGPNGNEVTNVNARVVVNNVAMWTDAVGDAMVRRTDVVQAGDMENFDAQVIDLRQVTVAGWLPDDPVGNPYVGAVVAPNAAHLLRLQIVFDGLVNPPGTIGLGGRPFEPFRYGPRPVYGFIEIDIDGKINTGGTLESAATLTYLANVARFGGRPNAAIRDRVALKFANYDNDISTPPQYERSGIEWVLTFCGCSDISIVSGDIEGDSAFNAGETWIMQSRFFQRTTGFKDVSASNGSNPGLYDPMVNLRFAHNDVTDTTTVTLVYPLDQVGAGMLAGAPAEPLNGDILDQHSIEEGMQDVIDFLGVLPAPGQTFLIADGWAGATIGNFLDPTCWNLTAIVGTTYSMAVTSLYVYTDVGFTETRGDLNGDGAANQVDAGIFDTSLLSLDGGPDDFDGMTNGEVVIASHARNFSMLDTDGDGFINVLDRDLIDPPPPPVFGDLNGDGVVGAVDLAILLGGWGGAPDAQGDLNEDGVVGALDLALMLGAWGNGSMMTP